MTNLDHRGARMQRVFDGVVASYIRDISGRGARRERSGPRHERIDASFTSRRRELGQHAA
jgi:hypothetical protein